MLQENGQKYPNSLVLKSDKFYFRQKMAAFDYDHTLVRPKNNRTFSKDLDDWEWINPIVKETIQSYYKKGYAIVIFTNQNKRRESIKFKIEQIKMVLNLFEVPYKAFIMMDKSIKKPSDWAFLQYNKNEKVNKKQSFFVGDALGRINDWSDSDKKFAQNCDLPFYSPEEIFLSKSVEPIKLNPISNQELVIMVGYPGSGKTTFVQNNFISLSNYKILHGDDLKTEAKIKSSLITNLELGKSVLIDATNPSKEKRRIFINIAKERNIPVRIIELSTSFDDSLNQNNQRENIVPKIAFYVFRKKYEKPSLDEGVNTIVEI